MGDGKVLCAECGVRHFLRLTWWHDLNCRGPLSARGVANAAHASNAVEAAASNTKAPKQRWDREKYNANAARYMREYRAARKKSRGNPAEAST